jgi:hypothetical protein
MHYIVDPTLARNCTTISPCQQDTVIIRDSEIKQNIVNACGRTEIQGNIDIGEETENELAANRVTQVRKGDTVAVTIHQVNADGAGPYECDLDQSSKCNIESALYLSLRLVRQLWYESRQARCVEQRPRHKRSVSSEGARLHPQCEDA